MTFPNDLFGSSLTLCAAGLLAGLALAACDLPDKNLGDDPPPGDTDSTPCQDGDMMMQDCNTCVCEEGTWACTEKGCIDTDGADSGGMTCDPATEPENECGPCQCEAGEWVCPEIGCDPTGGPECVDGDTMMQDCNTCFCENGAWLCTEIACPENPPVTMCEGTEPDDVVFINDASISGDILTVAVEYSGGCGSHWLGSCWDGSFAESNPVQAWLDINHESNDPCEAIEQQDVTFDLTPLRDAWHDGYGPGNGTIILHVGDWGTVDYSF